MELYKKRKAADHALEIQKKAFEHAAAATDKIIPKKVSSRDLSKEEIKKIFGVVTND